MKNLIHPRFRQICLLLGAVLILSGLWLISPLMAAGGEDGWGVQVTASPDEVWAQPGDTVTVTFSAHITGSMPATKTEYGTGRVLHVGEIDWNPEGDLTLDGDVYTKSIVLSPYASNYDTQLKGVNVAQVNYYGDDGTVGAWVSEGNSTICIIHVRANPTPTPVPTPRPTATPRPTPIPTPRPTPTPYPTPIPLPTPLPTPTPTPQGGVWSPTEKQIGYHRVGDGWQADGCMTAPVDQSAGCGTVAPTPTQPTPTPTPRPTATPTSPPYPTPTYPPSPTPTYPTPQPYPTYPTPPPLPAPQPYPTYPGVPPGAAPLAAPLTAPASTSSDSAKVVAAGAEVPCAVQVAQDFDTYRKTVNGTPTTTYAADAPLTYVWSADRGRFKDDITTGRNVTWIAPDDISEATTVTIKCTIDDPPGARVNAPDTGTHDDAATVRSCQVKVVPRLTLALDKTSIVAGGWDDTRKAYEYLEKETGEWETRDQKPDPHIATATATLVDDKGNPLAGQAVTFKWDMPGPAPAETRTATTDGDGNATVDVVSGDTLSKAFDEEDGHLLYDEPVKIEATYDDLTQSKDLDVLVPTIEWQIKNPDGDYVAWDGDTWDNYYKHDETHNVPLRALLTFNGSPVIGHRVSWGFDKILDKAEVEVPETDPTYITYGRMSGAISTTPADGGATATYTLGYNFGQIIFAIDDSSVYQGGFAIATLNGSSEQKYSALTQPTGERRSDKRFYKGKHTGAYDYVYNSPYNDLDGRPNSVHKHAYPAPSGEEDLELIQQTRQLVTTIFAGGETGFDVPRPPHISESKTGWRLQKPDFDGGIGEHLIYQNGDWWFSQIVGDDPESFGYHKADVKVPIPGKSTYRYYSGAFDIVFTAVPIFAQVPNDPRNNGRRAEFGPYVKALRDNGFVAWHRWAGEEAKTSENEMHCIDPATPFLKNALEEVQIPSFLAGETGGGGYPNEPPYISGKPDSAQNDFTITPTQKSRVKGRINNPLQVPGAQRDNLYP